MILGGPIGMIAGGIVMAAGINGEVATIQQVIKDEEFKDGQVLT